MAGRRRRRRERDADADGAGLEPAVVAAAAAGLSVGSLLLACMHFYADVYFADHAVGVGRGASGGVELCDAGFVHRGRGALAHFDAHPLLVRPDDAGEQCRKSAYKASTRAPRRRRRRAARRRAARRRRRRGAAAAAAAEAIVEALIAARPE